MKQQVKRPSTGHWLNPNICNQENLLSTQLLGIGVVTMIAVPMISFLLLGALCVKINSLYIKE